MWMYYEVDYDDSINPFTLNPRRKTLFSTLQILRTNLETNNRYGTNKQTDSQICELKASNKTK